MMLLTRELETLFIIIVASALGLFAVFYIRQSQQFQSTHIVAPLPNFLAADTPTPTPTVVPPSPVTTSSSWGSSDGTKEISMKTATTKNVSSTYTFSITDTATNTTKQLYIQTIPGVSTMSIPFNAFSSDNSYVFLKETKDGEYHYLVFKSSGELFANGQAFLDVTPLFAAYTKTYTISDVTGWADPTLLVVNATSTNGTLYSFWFDVASHSFIPLENVFE